MASNNLCESKPAMKGRKFVFKGKLLLKPSDSPLSLTRVY